MQRFLRQLFAALALAAVAGPCVPLPAAAEAGCACSSRCCCTKPGGDGGCRLSAPCGGAQERTGSGLPTGSRPAVIDAAFPAPLCAAPSPSVPLPRHVMRSNLGEPPPVPPPRRSAGC